MKISKLSSSSSYFFPMLNKFKHRIKKLTFPCKIYNFLLLKDVFLSSIRSHKARLSQFFSSLKYDISIVSLYRIKTFNFSSRLPISWYFIFSQLFSRKFLKFNRYDIIRCNKYSYNCYSPKNSRKKTFRSCAKFISNITYLIFHHNISSILPSSKSLFFKNEISPLTPLDTFYFFGIQSR